MADRDRSPRRDRRSGGGGPGARPDLGKMRKGPADKRIFISNLPYEMKWQEVKDLFRQEVGEVSYVELFYDERGKPRHCDRQLVLLRVRRPVAPLRQSKLLFRKEITCLHPIPPFAEALRMSKQKLETSIVYVISCRD